MLDWNPKNIDGFEDSNDNKNKKEIRSDQYFQLIQRLELLSDDPFNIIVGAVYDVTGEGVFLEVDNWINGRRVYFLLRDLLELINNFNINDVKN